MAMKIDMTGKVALVTGAASGLGRASALKLAEAGAKLCIADVNAQGLAETEALLAKQGTETLIQVANLGEAEACQAAVEAAVALFGRLDALCNVAGIIILTHTHEMSTIDWNRTIAINLSGPFFMSRAAIPHLLESQGAIVNVASSAALLGEAYAGAYCASKAGLVGLTKAMAMEYARKPIRINAIAPGGMMTNIAADMRIPEDAERDLIQRYLGLRGCVETDDVADLVTLLASPAGRSYHGACVSIDAGIAAG